MCCGRQICIAESVTAPRPPVKYWLESQLKLLYNTPVSDRLICVSVGQIKFGKFYVFVSTPPWPLP